MASPEGNVAIYDAVNLFPLGTAHHAAETGSLEEMAQVEAANRERGYPVSVTLETRDDILQCMPLHVAAEKGRLNVVEYLIKHGVDMDAVDGHGVRPLHLAAITNRLDIVNLLINKGANPTKQDSEGDVPLHWASTKGYIEMMEVLMDRGSTVDAPNKQGWTALHRAAYTGHVQACRLLLRRGAGLNALTRESRTALHLAALQNQLGVMELLLDMGAGTHFRDSHGATAADLCINDAARGLLQEKSAAQAGSRGAAAGPGGSRPASSSSAAAAAKQAPSQLTSKISRVPDMPRFRPAQNDNLDADGFPVAIQAQAEDLHGGTLADDVAGTEVFAAAQLLLAAQEPELLEMGQVSSIMSDRPSLVSYRAPLQQRPGQLSASSSFGRNPARFSGAGAAAVMLGDAASCDQEGQQQGWTAALLAPQQKPAGPNRKFLEQYGLHRMGLFAP